MAERLTSLMKVSEVQYASGSPLLLEACALYQDTASGQCIAQLKWKNLDPRPVKAVMIELDSYDVFNQKLEPINFQYDGLMAAQGSEFGSKVPVIIPNSNAVRYDTILKAVSFVEGDVWQADHTVSFAVLPKSKEQELKGELLEQFKRDLSKQVIISAAQFQPQTSMGLWQCGCGSWQYEGAPCLKCKMTQKALSEMSDETTLAKHLTEYKIEQENLKKETQKKAEEARLIREKEDAERKEKEEADRIKREKQRAEAAKRELVAKKKKRTVGIIIAIALVLIAGAVYAVTQIVIPGNHYKDAESAYQSGQYLEAYEAFSQARNYQDANEQAKRSAYSYADDLLQKGDYEQAYSYYQLAQDYTDAQAKGNSAAQFYAQSFEAQFDYSNAEIWYQKAGLTEQVTRMKLYQRVGSAEKIQEVYTEENYKGDKIDGLYKYYVNEKESSFGLIFVGKQIIVTEPRYENLGYWSGINIVHAYSGSNHILLNITTDNLIELNDCSQIVGTGDEGITYKTSAGYYRAISLQGVQIFNSDYEDVGTFREGLCPVKKDGLYGYIDLNENVVIDFQFEKAESFSNGYAEVYLPARKIRENDLYVSYNAGWGIIDRSGAIIIIPEWEHLDITDTGASDGKVVVIVKNKDGLYGLYNLSGKEVLAPSYDVMGKFGDGLVYVQKSKGDLHTTVAKFVDAEGKTVIDLRAMGYDAHKEDSWDAPQFVDGCAEITYWTKDFDLLHLLLHKTGKVLLQDEAWISIYSGERIEVSPKSYGKNIVIYSVSEGGELIRNGSNQTSIPKQSAFLSQWGHVYSFSEEGIARVALNSHEGTYGEIYDPPFGYIRENETVLVDPIFEDALDFENGYAAVKSDTKLWGIIDANGDFVIQPKYNSLTSVTKNNSIVAGVISNSKDDLVYRIINLDDVILIDQITEYKIADDQYVVKVFLPEKKVNQWQIFDTTGKRLF